MTAAKELIPEEVIATLTVLCTRTASLLAELDQMIIDHQKLVAEHRTLPHYACMRETLKLLIPFCDKLLKDEGLRAISGLNDCLRDTDFSFCLSGDGLRLDELKPEFRKYKYQKDGEATKDA